MSTRLLAALVLGVVFLFATACGPTAAPSTAGEQVEVTMANGLKYTDDQVGTGAEATTGKTAVVHYTGWLTDGTKFDSSRDRGQPFEFTLGAGQVIQRLGRRRRRHEGRRQAHAHHPARPRLRRARLPAAVIPPNATLDFEVELVDVR